MRLPLAYYPRLACVVVDGMGPIRVTTVTRGVQLASPCVVTPGHAPPSPDRGPGEARGGSGEAPTLAPTRLIPSLGGWGTRWRGRYQRCSKRRAEVQNSVFTKPTKKGASPIILHRRYMPFAFHDGASGYTPIFARWTGPLLASSPPLRYFPSLGSEKGGDSTRGQGLLVSSYDAVAKTRRWPT